MTNKFVLSFDLLVTFHLHGIVSCKMLFELELVRDKRTKKLARSSSCNAPSLFLNLQ